MAACDKSLRTGSSDHVRANSRNRSPKTTAATIIQWNSNCVNNDDGINPRKQKLHRLMK